jgi:hypothetical protein
MDKNEFKQRLSIIKSAISVTGKKYSSIQVFGDNLEFVRENKTKSENISITELFDLFTKENCINTSIAKAYISGRVQSPAVAILNKLELPETNNITENVYSAIQEKPIIKNNRIKQTSGKIKDETRFFIALSELLGKDYLISKSIGKPINSSHIFLSNNFEAYGFNSEVNDCYLKILTDLKSNRQFSSDSLSHHIDCVVINHPILKNRIIEFDEEQHFTPARMETLKHLFGILPNNYFSNFTEICKDKNYLNDCVLKKHRIKNKLENVPKSFIEFLKWLEASNEKTSGYICEKNGFEFIGGRIAQRAYYDCLRDTAHLTENNENFESPLRFAKRTFEDKEKMDFSLIANNKIKEIIVEILKKDYKIRIPSA